MYRIIDKTISTETLLAFNLHFQHQLTGKQSAPFEKASKFGLKHPKDFTLIFFIVTLKKWGWEGMGREWEDIRTGTRVCVPHIQTNRNMCLQCLNSYSRSQILKL